MKSPTLQNPAFWLQTWLATQLQKNSHQVDIQIGVIENPGWEIIVRFADINSIREDRVEVERSEDDWYHATLETNKFQAYCGPTNLEETIGWLRSRIDTDGDRSCGNPVIKNPLNWLQGWFLTHCSGGALNKHRVFIQSQSDFGWHLRIELEDTCASTWHFNPVRFDGGEGCFFEAEVMNGVFQARGSAIYLEDMIHVFREWVIKNLVPA